jgi:myo-inositol 2-dehydrogenase/D-chiro-inositol 1-dehydrogenase
MDTVGVGLAGLGRIGRMHAGNIAYRCSTARLAAVFDLNADGPREWGERLGVPWTTSYDELLERCDAVAIATPTGTHAELVMTAARAGRPVFCEKPISSDRATTVEVLDAVAVTGVPLQVGFHRRFDPDWVSVAQRLPELGEMTLLRTSLRDMTPPPVEFIAGSGGFFADVTVHDLDVARWLVGEIVEVSAHGAASDPAFAEVGDIDTAVVVLKFASGALGIIDNSRGARYGYECSTELMGTRATARVETPRAVEWRTPGRRRTRCRRTSSSGSRPPTPRSSTRSPAVSATAPRRAAPARTPWRRSTWPSPRTGRGAAADRSASSQPRLRAGSSTRSRSHDG